MAIPRLELQRIKVPILCQLTYHYYSHVLSDVDCMTTQRTPQRDVTPTALLH